MNHRGSTLRQLVLGSLLLALLALVIGLATASYRRQLPDLRDLDTLLQARRYDEAETRLVQYLQDRPLSVQANMLMAQVALARPDQKPELALKRLRKISSREPGVRAIVCLNEGKAYSCLGRYDLAEHSWKEALRIDPRVPEAGWALLGQYYVQGRREDVHRLAMRLRETEPDPRDRAQLLLELLRQDAKPLAAETVVPILEPIVRDHPEDLHTGIALGLVLIRTSRPGEGLPLLRRLVDRFPDEPAAWDALMTGFDESFDYDELSRTLERLPARLQAAPRFAKHRGILAQSRRQWGPAAEQYRKAYAYDPSDSKVLYRLNQVLRTGRRETEAAELDPIRRAHEAAREQALKLYNEADAVPTLGTEPRGELCHRLADLREAMGRPDEALAWHRLVLEHEPDDPTSRVAVERLAATTRDEAKGLSGPRESGP